MTVNVGMNGRMDDICRSGSQGRGRRSVAPLNKEHLASTFLFAFGLSFLILTAPNPVSASDAQGVSGAWELRSYELNHVSQRVSGIVIFQDDAFAMLYAMKGADDTGLSARAHIGAYDLGEKRLTFDVRRWFQKVDGDAGFVPPKVVKPDFNIDDNDVLTLNFEGGSRQILERLAVEDHSDYAGLWTLEAAESGTAAKVSDGTMIIAGGRFIATVTDQKIGKGVAYAGLTNRNLGHFDVHLELTLNEGRGMVSLENSESILQLVDTDKDRITLQETDGAVLHFYRSRGLFSN